MSRMMLVPPRCLARLVDHLVEDLDRCPVDSTQFSSFVRSFVTLFIPFCYPLFRLKVTPSFIAIESG